MATATDEQLLTLAHWFSPAYPVGAFHFSHGLEAAIELGQIRDAESLKTWIENLLRHGSGRNDAVFIAAAFRAETREALNEIDALSRAFAGTLERRRETEDLGAAFRAITAPLLGRDLPDHVYPVAIGHALSLANLPLQPAIALFLQAFTANLVSVGQRLIPIGQEKAQQIIAALRPLASELAEECADGDLDRLGGLCFGAEIASMQHETQYSRVFRT